MTNKHIPGPVMAGLLPIGYKPMDNDSRKVEVQKVKYTEPMDDEGSPISFVAWSKKMPHKMLTNP